MVRTLAKPITAGIRTLFPGSGRRGPLPDPIRSILLVELTALGDAVTLLYVIRAFRSSHPGAVLHILVDTRFAQLLRELSPDIEVHGIRRPDHPAGVLRAIRAARTLDVEVALSVSPAYRNAAVVLASRAPSRAGYLRTGGSSAPSRVRNPVEGIGFDAPEGILYHEEGWLERRWKLFDLFGVRPDLNTGGFALPETLLRDGERRLRHQGIMNGRAHVVIHPFASWHFRSWPVNRYLELIGHMLEESTHDVVVLCGEEDRHRLQPFRERFAGSERVRVYSSGSLLDSAVLIGGARALIGNDSGPLHLAAAVGTPAVGIYGPSNPRHTAPPRVRSVYCGAECSPCDQQYCDRPGHPCMSAIGVGQVMAAVRNVLREGSQRAGGER